MTTIRKIVIHRPGGFERLQLEEHHLAEPEDDYVQVETTACGVNYADVIVRWGLYKSAREYVGWPITPGFEFSGRISAVGKNVTRFKKGDPVFGVTRFGGYSTALNVQQHQVFHLPEGADAIAMAGFAAVYMTAYHALLQNVVVRPGQLALVHSAAGGVGGALLQLCRLKGIQTVAVVGGAHKVEAAKAGGAEAVIDYRSEDLWARLDELYPGGFDLVFDANGGRSLKEGFRRLKPMGRMIVYGAHTMLPKHSRINWPLLVYRWLREPSFRPVDFTNKSLVTFNLSFLFENNDLLSEAVADLLQWYRNKKLTAADYTTFALGEAAEAHRLLQSGQTTGKVILTC